LIIRPAETNAGLKAPAIIDTSPYYGPATVVTGPVGSHTYTVTATDNAGNFELAHAHLQRLLGELRLGRDAQGDGGQGRDVRFSLGGSFGLDVMAAGSPRSVQVSCTTGAKIGSASATSGSLSYASGAYTYAWSTPSSWKNTCRTFGLALDDNTQHTLTLQFK
jgi:hypothetical protein